MKGYELFYNNFTVVTGVFYYLDYNNCKELQETGMYDYGARMLMPDLGRWGSMDAMSEKYSAWSPYNYAINNPVMVIDPDGNDISYSGEAAQQAFKAYVAIMSTSTETSGGNIFTGFDFNSFLDDITVDYRGKIIKIDANNKPNRFLMKKDRLKATPKFKKK
ncbi:RHS repeat-associated core domain [Chryseobacterium gleum]|uniref:RHS repeat-associated core domain n=2 Tax=Chryseobacterium gleum TaxID=250 RepID=A0A448B7Y7_CHRGE|nr:RHS repeat-associated core domain-containing protein [Chryseobacterium gleum]EFK36875.1 RHS repeat-associated core domain protein [Chryseobacterium gleum ATCC 35910]QQY32123.1 hypothetical protein I6I60_25380 [Chryseobacterium gleum]VEE10652.1 RHS repeat-associated core domain [Chryseobacterium gleum]